MNPMMSGGVGMMPPGPPMGMMPSMNMMPMSGPPMGSMGMGMMGGQGMYQEDDYGMRNIQQVVQAPPMMMEKHFFNNVRQPPAGPNFEMTPEFMDRIVEVPQIQEIIQIAKGGGDGSEFGTDIDPATGLPIPGRSGFNSAAGRACASGIGPATGRPHFPGDGSSAREQAIRNGNLVEVPMTREAPVIEFCQETLPPLEIS